MRILLLFIFIIHFSMVGFSQHVIQKDKAIPKRKTKSVKKLTAALTKDSCGDYVKAKRMYDWITENIKYDVKRYDKFNWKATTPKQTLRRRKAICSGYSLLFQALCEEAGINAWVVNGYDKLPNYRNNEPYFFEEHAWNVFEAEGAYHLVDVTWGSGGIRRKMKMIVLFNRPIYFHKSKFVRKYNGLFFDSDTSWFLQSHVPLLPMWQLKTRALSVERFEKQIFTPDSLPKHVIPFTSDIQFYDSKTKEDTWLYDGNKGHDFFLRNNRTKALNTYSYLIDYVERFNLCNKKCLDKTRKKIAGSYADTVVLYGRKFFKDNAVRHKYVLDSISNRNDIIRPFSNKLYKEELSNRKKIKWQMKRLKQQITVQNNTIKRRHIGFARVSGDDIERIRSSYSKKHPDTLAKIISAMKYQYTMNTKKIDSLNVSNRFWNDSVQAKMPDLDAIHTSMEQVYYTCMDFIAYDTEWNRRLLPSYMIRMNQDSILLARRRLSMLQNEYTAVQRYMFAVYFSKHIDLINKASVALIKQNKSLIKRIAKISTQNDAEKKMYRMENKKLYQQLVQTTKRSEVKIQILNKNCLWLNEYKKILKAELSVLRGELWVQHMMHKYSSKLEAKRNKHYFHLTLETVKTALKIKKIVR